MLYIVVVMKEDHTNSNGMLPIPVNNGRSPRQREVAISRLLDRRSQAHVRRIRRDAPSDALNMRVRGRGGGAQEARSIENKAAPATSSTKSHIQR
jgi:hypothetical protein